MKISTTIEAGKCFLAFVFLIGSYSLTAAQQAIQPLVFKDGGWVFEWDLMRDKAKALSPKGATVWQGSLMPAFWLRTNQKDQFVKAAVVKTATSANNDTVSISLRIGLLGRGNLIVIKEKTGISIAQLEIQWTTTVPAIIEMYFGASVVEQKGGVMEFTWDRPFMPDWQSFGYCVPGAKGGTPQSYFRMWDFGQANIALGSFGPSTGTPYAAAFPRPLYYAAMGSNDGYVAIGAGEIPDAAMSLRIQSTRGCFQYIYREDLWGALPGKSRKWKQPLRITMAENPWQAFKKYYTAFPAKKEAVANATKAIWNTWGMWGRKKYVVRPVADFAKKIHAGIMVMDDPWESSQGSGKPNLVRFPDFYKDLDYIRAQGLLNGIWETVGWITDPFSNGLTNADLILNKDGKPCKANWNFDPWQESYYCLDISSPRTRAFIRDRTIRIMKTIKPSLIKLDFGYGFPSPHMGVPKDPLYRGEKYSYEMVRLISEAAKSVDKEVAIMYYSLSPLALPVIDLVSMDDQGDLWYDVARGHQEWSIWSSLLSDKNVGVNGSSSYNWLTDDEVLLNTAIIGLPGGVLPIHDLLNENPIPDQFTNRRLAVHRSFRNTTLWTPLWLNSSPGNFDGPPKLNCWGRMETSGADTVLTALALRMDEKEKINDKRIASLVWEGRWVLIAKDNKDLFSSDQLSFIPFDPGFISFPYATKPSGIIKMQLTGDSSYDKWEWNNGQLTIRISSEELKNTGGFIVNR